MNRDPIPWRVLFWGTTLERGDNARGGNIFGFFAELVITGLRARSRGETPSESSLPRREPKDYVRKDVPAADRKLLAEILAGGQQVEAYMGNANCRICGVTLGHRDLGAHLGPYLFIWPEKAEHYVLEHGVWTSECQRLLDFAKADS